MSCADAVLIARAGKHRYNAARFCYAEAERFKPFIQPVAGSPVAGTFIEENQQ